MKHVSFSRASTRTILPSDALRSKLLENVNSQNMFHVRSQAIADDVEFRSLDVRGTIQLIRRFPKWRIRIYSVSYSPEKSPLRIVMDAKPKRTILDVRYSYSRNYLLSPTASYSASTTFSFDSSSALACDVCCFCLVCA